MYRHILITFVVLVGLQQTVHATVVVRVKAPDEPVFYDSERVPKQIKDLAAAPGRVLATVEGWSGGDDYLTVYFRGDATALNRTLGHLASLPQSVESGKDLPRVLIRDDLPEASKRLGEEYRGSLREHYQETVPKFDWALRIDSHGDAERLTVNVFIDIWLSDRMALEDLKIPPELRVKAVSRIEQFADLHETNRLAGREAMLNLRIRDLREEVARLERRKAATQPAAHTPNP